MIRNHDQGAFGEVNVQPTGCAGENDGLDTDIVKQADTARCLAAGVPLV